MPKSNFTVRGFFLALGRFRTGDGACREEPEPKELAPAKEVTCVTPDKTEIPEVPEKKDTSVATPDLSGTPDSEVCCDCGPKDYNVPCCEPCSDDDDWADDGAPCCDCNPEDWTDDEPCDDEEDWDDEKERLLRMGNQDLRKLETSKLRLRRSQIEDSLKYLKDFLEKADVKKGLLSVQIEEEQAKIESLFKSYIEACDSLHHLFEAEAKNNAEITIATAEKADLQEGLESLDQKIKEQAMNVILVTERGVSTPNDPDLMNDSGFEDVFGLLCGKKYAAGLPVATLKTVAKTIVAEKRVENPRIVWDFPAAEELFHRVTEETEEILASEG